MLKPYFGDMSSSSIRFASDEETCVVVAAVARDEGSVVVAIVLVSSSEEENDDDDDDDDDDARETRGGASRRRDASLRDAMEVGTTIARAMETTAAPRIDAGVGEECDLEARPVGYRKIFFCSCSREKKETRPS
jgi:hypothetical protein